MMIARPTAASAAASAMEKRANVWPSRFTGDKYREKATRFKFAELMTISIAKKSLRAFPLETSPYIPIAKRIVDTMT